MEGAALRGKRLASISEAIAKASKPSEGSSFLPTSLRREFACAISVLTIAISVSPTFLHICLTFGQITMQQRQDLLDLAAIGSCSNLAGAFIHVDSDLTAQLLPCIRFLCRYVVRRFVECGFVRTCVFCCLFFCFGRI